MINIISNFFNKIYKKRLERSNNNLSARSQEHLKTCLAKSVNTLGVDKRINPATSAVTISDLNDNIEKYGQVWGWGYNNSNQLKDNLTINKGLNENKSISNLTYSQYIAENIDRSINYSEYISQCRTVGMAGTRGFSGTPGIAGTSGFPGIAGTSGSQSWISKKKEEKDIKRVYSDLDPYGEEDWEE